MPKQMPFTKDDYFRQLEDMLKMPAQQVPTTGNPLIDRLRNAAQRFASTAFSGTAFAGSTL